MQRESFGQNSRAERPTYAIDAAAAKRPNPELLEQFYQYQKAKRQKAWRQFSFALLIVVVAASAATQGYGYYRHRLLVSQVPASIRQSIDFPVYLPAQPELPPDQQSLNYSNGVLLFVVGGKDVRVTIYEQKKPVDFDISKFSTGEGLTETKEITINGNKVLMGKVHGLNIAIMDTGQSIVTVTSAAAQPSATIESIVRSLKKI